MNDEEAVQELYPKRIRGVIQGIEDITKIIVHLFFLFVICLLVFEIVARKIALLRS